jgi:hypothetical protein
VAVRVISEDAFGKIISNGGLEQPPLSSEIEAPLDLTPFENVNAQETTDNLLRPTKSYGKSGKGGGNRYSKYSKELGDRGEEVVLYHLKKTLPDKEKETLRWSAKEGEKRGGILNIDLKVGSLGSR